MRILKAYPEFEKLYEEIYVICQNVEEVMKMFSEELRQLDRNTVQYMIDEMQEENDRKTKIIEEKEKKIAEVQEEKEKALAEVQEEKEKALAEKEQRIQELERKLAEQQKAR